MPNFEQHKKIGYFASLVFACAFFGFFYMRFPTGLSGWKVLIIPIVIYFYSNIVDMDHWKSKIRKQVFMMMFFALSMVFIIYIVFGIYVTLLIVSMLGAFGLFVYKQTHRKLMHTYLFILAISLPLIYFHWYIALTGFVAGSSHIFIDRLSSKSKRIYRKLKKRKIVSKLIPRWKYAEK